MIAEFPGGLDRRARERTPSVITNIENLTYGVLRRAGTMPAETQPPPQPQRFEGGQANDGREIQSGQR